MDNRDYKYVDLISNICIDSKRKSIFLSYCCEISPFIEILKSRLNDMGINDIYEEVLDPKKEHEILSSISIDEIDNHPYFNKYMWDEYAKKGANFLMFETEYPGLMDDIDAKKIARSAKVRQSTKPIYRSMQNKCEIPWAIVAYPGECWASSIYPNDTNSYEKLKNDIFHMCMIDKDNVVESWNEVINKNSKIANYLTRLNIDKLHYTNSLGTDLWVTLPNDYIYESALDNGIMANLPSYEVFTSPVYNKTEGIVYSSKPLMYNGGIVDEFYVRFNEGKVIEVGAKRGKDILEGIITNDSNSCYLGECALVCDDSLISRMNTIFKTTLIDENASCHIALGAGFPECIKGGLDMSDEELLKHGVNDSKTHVDFMIGTSDMRIDAILKDGSSVCIFDSGTYSKDIINNIKF